ncbi:M20 aminoacylase family protein [Pantoea phytobeneficialis]|uniref:Amidohydrolase n=1 Tax=Pantoea phytobeneficialis TaxID=2052056 RepID=A0AAP9HAK8_9GAMM|nr:M20 aminoacylase family protein [Pantoea phytobeneficialis]MDO6406767.1 M20 aminoacylase family protein [Pantoea phytobeneficialis]QGR09294.1 amidohydrolase [Pantoea phytobeneficialis]
MLIKEILAFEDEMIAIRRDFHQHPELGFEEVRTSARIAELLTSWGYDVHRGLGGTGVVGTLKAGNGSKRLGLRADMDALPMQELADIPWRSQVPGKMHACGHDGHCAMLLSAARYLAEKRPFSGTLHVIFQPSEESYGGARRMMDDGLFRLFPCDAVFGLHNFPLLPAGHFFTKPGPLMASSDSMTITLHGKGGHGATPENTLDPTVAGAAMVMALQTIVSRNVDPQDAVVVTVGSLQSGSTHNVIPDSALLKLNLRTFSAKVREQAKARIEQLVQAQAASFGLTATIQPDFGYPVTINHAAETDFATQVARDTFGADCVADYAEVKPLMGSEDFAFMLEDVPGNYIWLGTSTGEADYAVHHPLYQFNDACLSIGATYWARLTEAFLR